MKSRSGSALVMAIWIIAILSLLVLNFATEAHLQTSVNMYMRDRIRAGHLTEAGIAIAETVILNFPKVSIPADDESEKDLEKLLEEDRWLVEKRNLKQGSKTTIGPILADKENPEGGTITIEIESVGGGENGGSKININTLFTGADGNPKSAEWWEGILNWAGVPEEPTEDREELIASWSDWRDTDDTKTGDDGAEQQWYDEEYEERDISMEERHPVRNGEIPDLKELAFVKGFYKYTKDGGKRYAPLLTGGKWDEDDPDSPVVKSILPLFSTMGGQKININLADADVLATIPGIGIDHNGDPIEEDVVGAILEARAEAPPEGEKFVKEEDYGPFTDWNDLLKRVPDIESEAQEYLSFTNDSNDGAQFKITLTGTSSSGLSHTVQAIVLVKNEKLRIVRWQEDP